jgi:hypothetical protein
MSTSSVASNGMDKPRRSFTGESSNPTVGDAPSLAETDSREGRGEAEPGRGLTGWIKNKYREAKETAEQRRNKSPPPAGPDTRPNTLGTSIVSGRGKSIDISRANDEVGRQSQGGQEEPRAAQ